MNWFKKKNSKSIKKDLDYSRDFIDGLMDFIVKSINEIKLGKEISLTITPNVYNREITHDWNVDAFCTIYKGNIANDLVFYGKTDAFKFIRWCDDDLRYGDYFEGAELSEGQFEISFEEPDIKQFDKLEFALGLYVPGENNFSANCVKEFIIVIQSEGISSCYILENTVETNSTFMNIISLRRLGKDWVLDIDLKCYDSTSSYVNENFRHLT